MANNKNQDESQTAPADTADQSQGNVAPATADPYQTSDSQAQPAPIPASPVQEPSVEDTQSQGDVTLVNEVKPKPEEQAQQQVQAEVPQAPADTATQTAGPQPSQDTQPDQPTDVLQEQAMVSEKFQAPAVPAQEPTQPEALPQEPVQTQAVEQPTQAEQKTEEATYTPPTQSPPSETFNPMLKGDTLKDAPKGFIQEKDSVFEKQKKPKRKLNIAALILMFLLILIAIFLGAFAFAYFTGTQIPFVSDILEMVRDFVRG